MLTQFLKALDVLASYLTSSAVAPLNKEYVEIESPLWYVPPLSGRTSLKGSSRSTYFYFAENVRATMVDLLIYVASVPTEHLETFDERFKESLSRIVKNGIDMERMTMVINRVERQVCNSLVVPLFFLPLIHRASVAKSVGVREG